MGKGDHCVDPGLEFVPPDIGESATNELSIVVLIDFEVRFISVLILS